MLTGVRDTGDQDMHEVNAKGILSAQNGMQGAVWN